MNSLMFVVTIVALGCLTAVVLKYLELRAEKDEQGRSADESSAQLDALEERIRVLERIVTEKRIDLRKEIDDL
jgi:hypothetical protein